MNSTVFPSSQQRFGAQINKFEVTVVCIHAFLTISTVFGNYLVIRAFIKFPHLRTASNSILVSLSMADLLMVPVFISRLVSNVMTKSPKKMCNITSMVSFTLNATIILHLAMISLERLIAIKFALRYHTMVTSRRALLATMGLWLYAILSCIAFPQAFKADGRETFREFIGGLSPCRFRCRRMQCSSLNSKSVLGYLVFLVTAHLFLPIAIVVVSYSYIFNIACKQRRRIIQDERTLQSITLTMKREMKAARNEAILVSLCLFSFVPLLVILCLHFSSATVDITKQHLSVAYIVASLSAFWNPLIYCWKSQHFRIAFKRLLKGNH